MPFAKQNQPVLICSILIVVAFTAGWMLKTDTSPALTSSKVIETPPSNETLTAPTGSAKLYATIEAIDSASATIRLVEWTQGQDNQEQSALESGTCTLEQIETNACLSNPFFIRKTDKRLTLPISNDVTIWINKPDEQDGLTFMKKTYWNIQEQPKETPYLFTTTNGSITNIREQYVP